ncbi:MAG: hypothetical protein AAF941_02840 [Pseudomonadota bacterium]
MEELYIFGTQAATMSLADRRKPSSVGPESRNRDNHDPAICLSHRIVELGQEDERLGELPAEERMQCLMMNCEMTEVLRKC